MTTDNDVITSWLDKDDVVTSWLDNASASEELPPRLNGGFASRVQLFIFRFFNTFMTKK